MLTPVQVSMAEYLATSYEGLDREYTGGEVIERPMPDDLHSETQARLAAKLWQACERLDCHTRVELRVRTGADRIRVVDLAVFRTRPSRELTETPPHITIEIASPSDSLNDIIEKGQEYLNWGVPHVWLCHPSARALFRFGSDGLHQVEIWTVPELSLTLSPDDVFGTSR